MINKAIIPAAGYGTRLLPITKILPKAMLPLLTKPAIQYVIDELVSAGVNQVIIITGWKGDLIKEYYRDEPKEMIEWLASIGREDIVEHIRSLVPGKVDIMFKKQEILDGLAGAILRGYTFIKDGNFIVSLGDNIIIEKETGSLIRDMITVHEKFNASVTLAVAGVPREKVERFGVIGYSNSFSINDIKVYELYDLKEKPSVNKAPSNLAIIGRYVLSPESIDYLRNAPMIKGELSETDAFKKMIEDGYKVLAVDLGDREWYDIGSIDEYIRASIHLAFLRDDNFGNKLFRWMQDKFLKK